MHIALQPKHLFLIQPGVADNLWYPEWFAENFLTNGIWISFGQNFKSYIFRSNDSRVASSIRMILPYSLVNIFACNQHSERQIWNIYLFHFKTVIFSQNVFK